MNFLSYENPPLFKIMSPLYSDFLKHDTILGLQFYLQKNYYRLKDTYLQILNWFDVTGSYYTVGFHFNKNYVGVSNPDLLFLN